ncbi:MAG: DNA repair protein RecN [Candidatus Omnitrophica bacterium]|nr:DNA repair protein RecN [Candidatus Omnitrophota bacterium]
MTDLSIRNFALIDSANIRFESGLNVLTGETGAGKSIVMEALSMVLGERASGDCIRTGCEQATVEAVFELDRGSPGYRRLAAFMEESGLEFEDTLILKRILSRSGRHRCLVNNSTTTLGTLNGLGELLVDLHGQHDHQTLLNPKNYVGILDAFGGLEEAAEELRGTYIEWREAHDRHQELINQERERNRILDNLRFQIAEIEETQPRPGEEEELQAERRRLRNFESLNEHSAAILLLLDGGEGDGPGALDSLGQIQSRIEEMAQRDPDLASARNLAENAAYALEDLARTVRAYHEQLEAQPGRLDEIESRLHLIANLKRKYGSTIEEILAFLARSKEERARLENYEEERANLEKVFQQLTQKLGKQATELSKRRRKVAKQVSGEVTLEMRQLGMEAGRFEAEVALIDTALMPNVLRINYPQDDESPITSSGWDYVHFRISTNPGEPLKSLRQVASGGEISRIMLAIKAVLSRVDAVDVLVFDEIDQGIGGKTAHVVGGKIKNLASERQVLCITHLAPIASRADHHLRIVKQSDGQTTSVFISALDGAGKTEELARMMGTEPSEGGLKVAEELLQQVAR